MTVVFALTPLIFPALGAATPNKSLIAAGWGHTLAIQKDGSLWAWGNNDYGQLGLGNKTDCLTPTQVGSATNWVALAAGGVLSLGLKADASLWSWGLNDVGQLGLGNIGATVLTPTQVGSDNDWLAVAAGNDFSLGLKAEGTLFSWGKNNYGQLGQGSDSGPNTPTRVGGYTNWVAIAAGNGHSLGVRSDGSLWGWGLNDHGQLGLWFGDTTNRNLPTQSLIPHKWVAIAARGDHSLGLLANGTCWAWGSNNFGQLGTGDTDDCYIPVQVGTGGWRSPPDGTTA